MRKLNGRILKKGEKTVFLFPLDVVKSDYPSRTTYWSHLVTIMRASSRRIRDSNNWKQKDGKKIDPGVDHVAATFINTKTNFPLNMWKINFLYCLVSWTKSFLNLWLIYTYNPLVIFKALFAKSSQSTTLFFIKTTLSTLLFQ